jgi:hypothetical protein
MHKKEVPVILVTDKTKADFELSGVTETERAGWAKTVFLMSTATNEQASIKIVNLKSGTIVFGYNVNKSNSPRGKTGLLGSLCQASQGKDRNSIGALMLRKTLLVVSVAFMTAIVSAQSGKASLKPSAKVFINGMADDFDTYVKAALAKKKVPLSIVESKENADLEK